MSLLLFLIGLAAADTITLDNGTVISGDLGVYQYGGDCQISVTDGDLLGAIVIVPCARVERFEKAAVLAPAVAPPVPPAAPALPPAEVVTAPPVVALAAVAPVDAPAATASVEAPPVEAPAASLAVEVPVAPPAPPVPAMASLPEGVTPPGAASHGVER